MPETGDVVTLLVPLLRTLCASGEQVPLDRASKVAGKHYAGGKSWQSGLLGLPMLQLATKWE